MVKVSVIIPAYNGDRYITDAIAGVLAQTYTDCEIIVVDDGSTDNTKNIIQQYRNKIKYYSQSNQGVAASRNLGLSKAKGEYIAFLDQDDVFLPHKLALQVAVLEREPALAMVNSGWQIVNQDGVFQSAVKPWLQIPQLTVADLIIWKPVFLGAMLFRRSQLESIADFDTSLEQTPDVDLVLRLAAKGGASAWVKQTTVKYRQHQDNASKNTLLQAQELDCILEKFFTQPNLSPEIKNLEAKSRYQSLVWSAWRLQQTGRFTEMAHYLNKSFHYSQKYPTEIILDWITSFKNYCTEYGTKLNIATLTSSLQWQTLIKQLMA